MGSVRTQTAHQRKDFGKMGTTPCEAESSGGGSRSPCPQIPRYFSALGRSCGALSAVCVSQGEVDWSFHGSGLAANQTAATSAHRIAELNIAVAGLGEYYKRAHVRTFFQSLDGWEVRGVRWKVWPLVQNYRLSVVKGPIAHDSAPNPLA